MERISDKSPCLNCCSDRQIGNPDVWQSDCYRCEKLPNWKAKVIDRLAAIEDILGDDYDLDRLKEMVEADREGKCVLLPCKIGSKLYRTSMRKMQVYEVSVSREYFHDSKNNATLFAVQIFENGKKSTSYECFKEKDIGKTVFLTRKEAEAALERMEGEEK